MKNITNTPANLIIIQFFNLICFYLACLIVGLSSWNILCLQYLCCAFQSSFGPGSLASMGDDITQLSLPLTKWVQPIGEMKRKETPLWPYWILLVLYQGIQGSLVGSKPCWRTSHVAEPLTRTHGVTLCPCFLKPRGDSPVVLTLPSH